MRDYCKNAGTSGYVLGLSGGVDSAVVAALAKKAVGKDKVLTLIMPCSSNPKDEEDAKLVASKLGISYLTLRLENILNEFKKCYMTNISKLQEGNIKARLRMTMLYANAQCHNFLVAGTGNKSEIMCGYFSKFGDGGVDIEPIGQYYKTEIFQLAKSLDVI